MTKAELIKALEGLPDDTEINVPSMECGNELISACYVQVEYYGINGFRPEVTILGNYQGQKE